MPRKVLIALMLLATSLLAVAQSNITHVKRMSFNPTSAKDACDAQFNVTYDDLQTFTAEEQKSLAQTAVETLDVEAAHNGGIMVEGWDRPEYGIRACKFVGATSEQEGKAALANITLRVEGNRVYVQGPSGQERWSAHLLLQVPKNAKLRLNAHNGPVEVQNVTGDVEMKTVNGPVDIKNSNGKISATAQNGPISVANSSGDIHLSAQNGPVTVKLNDDHWTGAGLEAQTHNGPLELRVPENYRSGVEVASSMHAPFSCHHPECKGTFDEENKQVHLGGTPTVIKLSTVNGPVSIASPTAGDDDDTE